MPGVMPFSPWSGLPGRTTSTPPDLNAPMLSAPTAAKPAPNRHRRLNSGQSIASRGGSKVVSSPAKPILDAEASATLRDQLVEELRALASPDEAAVWAHRILGAKNSLTEADARQVEDKFQSKLETLDERSGQPSTPSRSAPRNSHSRLAHQAVRPIGANAGDGIDKSRLTHPEPRRFRDKEHVKFVAKQVCLICARRPADAHHLRFAQHRALGRKVSDEFTVPLCRGHHREAHRCGDEAAWWKNAGVDPTIVARSLWLETHPLPRNPKKMGNESTSSIVVCAVGKSRKHCQPLAGRGPNDETKPISGVGPK
jgi:hypothetical protein